MFDFLLSPDAWLAAGLIFSLRVTDMALDTVRIMMVVRGKKAIAWILGFLQATVFILAIGSVLGNLDNPLNILGYAAGFATGNVVGMIIEEKLAIGYIHLRIVSPGFGQAIAQILREEGYAVTEIPAMGKDGMVTMLTCSVLRKNVGKVQEIINKVSPEAFVTAEDVRAVRRGFWRA